MKQPVLFLGHGSPMNALAENEFTKKLGKLATKIPTPKLILVISAHWETKGTWVTGMDKPKTIHDFFGFPQALFNVQYPAPGDSNFAKSLSLNSSDPNIGLDENNWGLDHGTWSVLRHMYPKANIPVVQLSIDSTKPFEYHYNLGKKLAKLREEGVLILGSGNIVHNLRTISWKETATPLDWALEFDNWIKERAVARDFKSLVESPLNTKAGKLSIPTPEHYLPLLYTLGAADEKSELVFDIEEIQNASISMRSFRFA